MSNSQGQNQIPTSQGPTSRGPTSRGPTSQGPTSRGPTSQAPTSQGPTSQGPTSQGQDPSSFFQNFNSTDKMKKYLLDEKQFKFSDHRQYWGINSCLCILVMLNLGAWIWMFLSIKDIKKCESKPSVTCPFFTCPVKNEDVQQGLDGEEYLPIVDTENGPELLDSGLEQF